jgi:AraC-like DNA-binding protein
MMDLARHFMGPSWTPIRAVVSGPALQAKSAIERTLGADLSLADVAGLCFPAVQLAVPNPAGRVGRDGPSHDDPINDDFLACVEHLILLKLLERRPSIDWICSRLGLSRRSFQRRLSERGTTFDAALRTVLERQAETMLARPDGSISQIAYQLGYADPAHFSRAFLTWKGISPRAWRQRSQGASDRPGCR